MEKVLILTYSFPPCNLTASQRSYSWAKHLHEFGYYPIIITRNWDHPISKPQDVYKNTGTKVVHEKKDFYEVYYLPYKSNFNAKLFVKDSTKNVFFRKTLTFFELFVQNFTNRFISLKNFFIQADSILEKDPSIKKVIITANPFILFKFGYQLRKKHKINWIADYRDDWTTDELKKGNKNLAEQILFLFDRFYEKKWIKSSSFFTTVSKKYLEKITSLTQKNGVVILNGFWEEEYSKLEKEELYEEYTITFNGTLYPTQPIEVFLDVFIHLIDFFKNKKNIKLCFPGLEYDAKQSERVKKYLGEYLKYTTITTRIEKEEVMKIQAKSHALLMLSHEGIKGVASSKLFEYIGFKKPIILFPNDMDIIENILNDTKLGQICNSKEELFLTLKNNIEIFDQKKTSYNTNIDSSISKYSRRIQTQKMANLLNKL